MESSPFISIIVPMYNAENYIERCILSIMNQTYPNIEVLVIDDGSKDNSGRIVLSLVEKFKGKLKYFKKLNSGVSATRNYGLEKASGNYFAFVDSDDYIASNMYESMLQLLLQHNADLVICGQTRVVNGKELHYPDKGIQHFYDGKIDMRLLSNQFDLNILCNKLYSRELWGDLRLPENMSYAEDLYLAPDILNRSKHIVYTSIGYYYYYENLSSASYCLSEEKLRSDIIAKEKLYKYILNKSVDTTIAFDLLFGAYTRGYNMGIGKQKMYFYKQYINFFFRNIINCLLKAKCILFLLSPYLYSKVHALIKYISTRIGI